MKHYIQTIYVCTYLAAMPLSAMAQDIAKSVFKYDKFGNIESVMFSEADRDKEPIRSEEVFFRDILKVKPNTTFVTNKQIRLEKGNDTFEQYFKGVKVENAGYTFHYDENGAMRYAHGNYVDISDLDIAPAISKEDAGRAFAKYRGLSPDSITDSSAELMIRRVKGALLVEIPLLVYKVSIAVNKVCVTEYGYVDAKTGDVVHTESYINYSAATGTFYTKYYGTKYATTNLLYNYYFLDDPSRGNGIVTRDLQNYCINKPDYMDHYQLLMDSDNNWYYTDFTDSTFMAFDVHWALQKIYDRLYDVHGKNSMDNNGKRIVAYVKAVFDNNGDTNNACWLGSREEFYFGIGSERNRPFSTMDVVAHEYGHGITQYQIGWSQSERFLNEGLSDIWAATMDYRFGDANAEAWKIGEFLPPSNTCIRDLEYPANPNASTQMASTFNSSSELGYMFLGMHYEWSGIFSHWFYLLVNGGQGYNSNGTYYDLTPVGMDVAENLIVKAVYDNYLRYTTTYASVRNAFVAAADAMNVDGLVNAVCNAWYAVGVGEMNLSLSGPDYTKTQSIYTIEGLPSGFSVVWSLSDNYYNQHCIQQATPSYNKCTITTDYYNDMMNATLTAVIKHNNDTIKTLTKTGLYAYYDFRGQYNSGNISGTINYTHTFTVKRNVTTYITSPMLVSGTASYSNSGVIPSYWNFNSTIGEIDMTMPTGNSNIPIILNVYDFLGNYYQLYAMPQNYKGLNISLSDNGFTVTLDEDSNVSENRGVEQPWTIEVRSAYTGELKAIQAATTRSATISTAGWPKCTYIVKVTVGNEVLTEKVIVK